MLIDGHEDGWPLEKIIKTSQDEGLLWLQWDQDNLYLLAQVYDENVAVPDVIEYYREADALELHINLQQTNYYVIEARIPFFPVLRGFHPLKTRQHNRIGFNFVIHRSNNQAIYWAAQIPEAGPVFPSDLGLLILESCLKSRTDDLWKYMRINADQKQYVHLLA